MGLCKSKPVRPTVQTVPLEAVVRPTPRPRLPVNDYAHILSAPSFYFVHYEHARIEQFRLLVPGLDDCVRIEDNWYKMSISLVFLVCSDAVPMLQRWWRRRRSHHMHGLAILHTTTLSQSADVVALIALYL